MKENLDVTTTVSGEWMHAPGSDFVFAFLKDSWSDDAKKAMKTAFENALKMSSTIKQAVKDTSGQTVVDGLYLLDQPAMTKAMNSITGLGMTSVSQKHMKGDGTAPQINNQFFTVILAGLEGSVKPMQNYLTQAMANVQAQAKKGTITSPFGTVMGLISLMPILDVPVTTWVYAYAAQSVSTWFENQACADPVTKHSYDLSFTVVNYNYAKVREMVQAMK